MKIKLFNILLGKTWRLMYVLFAIVFILDVLGAWLFPVQIVTDHLQMLLCLPIGCATLGWLLMKLPLLGLYQSESGENLLLRVVCFFAICSYLLLFTLAVALLSYFAVLLRANLVDVSLAHFGQALGFDWLGFFNWVQAQPTLVRVLALAYSSPGTQGVFVLIFCAACAPLTQLSEFVCLYVLSLFCTVFISAAFPAEGAFFYYGQLHTPGALSVSDFRLLRAGSLSLINLDSLQGLVSMPSFHACMAIMFPYALRHNRLVLACAVLLNAVMMVSAIICGGHYLADLLAAGLLMALLIGWQRYSLQEKTEDPREFRNIKLTTHKKLMNSFMS